MKRQILLSILSVAAALGATAKDDFVVDRIHYRIVGDRTVEVIAGDASENEALQTVAVPATVTYGRETFAVTGIADDAFLGCGYLSSVRLPQSLETIGANAFNGCFALSSITVPASVRSIGDGAFVNSGVDCITFRSATPPVLDTAGSFGTLPRHISVPSEAVDRYMADFPELFEGLSRVEMRMNDNPDWVLDFVLFDSRALWVSDCDDMPFWFISIGADSPSCNTYFTEPTDCLTLAMPRSAGVEFHFDVNGTPLTEDRYRSLWFYRPTASNGNDGEAYDIWNIGKVSGDTTIEVNITSDVHELSPETMSADKGANVYTLDGKSIGTASRSVRDLPKGVYVMRKGNESGKIVK